MAYAHAMVAGERRMTLKSFTAIACLAMLFAAGQAAADTPPPIPPALAGHWEGELVQQGQALALSFDFAADAAAPSGRFSADRWRVMDYPLGGWKLDGKTVAFGAPGLELDGQVVGDAMDGTGTFTLHRTAAHALRYREIAVSFRNGDAVLSGTLAIPSTPGRHPAVVLAHGSGPEVRWGTNRYIADTLARAGIVALVYDKRGSGQSTGDWRTADYADLARDALAGVALLATRPEVDARRVGILGHSEGGIVAPIAATLAPDKVAFIIAEDAPAQRIKEQDVYRVNNDIQAQAWSDADKAKAREVYQLFVDVAAGDRPMADYEAAMAKYKDAEWFQYLGLPPKDHWIWAWYAKRAHLDTATLWTSEKRPVLLVYGEADQLMPVDRTLRTIEDKLDASATPYTALIAPRAEHNLTIHPKPGEPFFWWRQAPGLNEAVAGWILRCTAPDGVCRTR
jgi:hypothetical protein